jgi:hypothetical protein
MEVDTSLPRPFPANAQPLTPMEEAEIGRYRRWHHAVQSAVAYRLGKGSTEGTSKALRTGINMQKAEMAGLAELLIAKGVITRAEYLSAMADGAEGEARRDYEEMQRAQPGVDIRFG